MRAPMTIELCRWSGAKARLVAMPIHEIGGLTAHGRLSFDGRRVVNSAYASCSSQIGYQVPE